MTTLKAHGIELYRVETVENREGKDWRTTISVRSCGAILYKADWRFNPPRGGYRGGYQGGHWSHLRVVEGQAHPDEWKWLDGKGHQAARSVWFLVELLVKNGADDVQVKGKLSAWPAWCKARR